VELNESFIADILASPEEPGLRLVYADWLEEQGDRQKSAYLRIQSELIQHREDSPEQCEVLLTRLRDLRPFLDLEWVARMDRVRVEACQVSFELRCPADWEKMRPTNEPTVRFCNGCQRHVYYCSTLKEVRDHVGPGHCVAIDSTLARHPLDLARRIPGFPSRNFFFPPGTTVEIIDDGEHAGKKGVVAQLHSPPQLWTMQEADVRLRSSDGEMITIVRIPLRILKGCDGLPTWGPGACPQDT
jgi:uncharacterized protein (TIGR02996 family)